MQVYEQRSVERPSHVAGPRTVRYKTSLVIDVIADSESSPAFVVVRCDNLRRHGCDWQLAMTSSAAADSADVLPLATDEHVITDRVDLQQQQQQQVRDLIRHLIWC